MKRLSTPALALLLLSAACDGPSVESPRAAPPAGYPELDLPTRPNILWLVAEDMSPYLASFGDPTVENNFMGPVVSKEQQETILGYIRKGIEEGATLLTGGTEPPEGINQGYYVKPTIFTDVKRDMTIAQEEIFGPVLCIVPYETEAEAIEIANDSIFGLSGGVWAGSEERARDVALKMRTGQVAINGGAFNLAAPFGGYKQSGNGRELGAHGLDEFLESKAINL